MLIVTALKVNTVICPMSCTQLSVLYDVQSVDFSGAEKRVGMGREVPHYIFTFHI